MYLILVFCNGAHPEEVSVSVVIQPVMDHYIPGTVIVGKGCRVPPVLENEKIIKSVCVWMEMKTE